MALVYKSLEDGSGIKMDENGDPLVVDDEKDEKEFGVRALDLYNKIPALQAEAKAYREERDKHKTKAEAFGELDPEEAVAKLKALGDLDIEEARAALDTVANLGDADREISAEIDKAKKATADGYKTKMRDIDEAWSRKAQVLKETVSVKDASIRRLLIKGAFDSSVFIKDQTVLPSEIAYNTFGKYFQIDEDTLKVSAIGYDGEKVFSVANPGEFASPEEAIELLIERYPQRDSIMRTTSGGSGAGGNTSSNSAKKQQLKALVGMAPAARLNELRRINAQ